MDNENHELALISNISKTFIETQSPMETIASLEKHFNVYGRLSAKFVELSKLSLFLYDENTNTLRDFSKSWIVLEKKNNNSYNDKLYLIIDQLAGFDFFINERPYRMGEMDFSTIRSKNQDNNILVPLKHDRKTFGIMELRFPHTIANLLDESFFMMLSIISYQVSIKIQNTILTNKMQKNIEFHRSMKDIAKIIESQYELSYIIPIIGEMIDRFVSEHLVYIFLKTQNSQDYKLVWPSTCRDDRIKTYVTHLTEKSKYILTDDGKIGLFPLVGEKSILGCIVAHSSTDKLSDMEIDYIEQLARQSSITIHRANVYADVLRHATLDALTGLNNRRQFETRLNQEVATAKRQQRPLCAIMMDIDFFKKFNDTYGHTAGDLVLKSVSDCIKKSIREYDIASRYGGEEFVILLPTTDINAAYTVAERLRQKVESTKVDIPREDGTIEYSLSVTISLGVYQYKETDTPQELYQNADKGLYASKEAGRNRVTINDGSLP